MLFVDQPHNELTKCGHADPLYRMLKGNPSTNMTKSPTLTLVFNLQANAIILALGVLTYSNFYTQPRKSY